MKEDAEPESYNAPESHLTRLPKPLVDTPQSVTVVSEAVLEEQQATTVRDALRNVSGITVSAGEGGRQGDTFNLRGFSAQTDTFRDGVRDLGWFTRDTFNLEGVEVFFGPSAVLFGRGSTGGALNLVTKKPERRSFRRREPDGWHGALGPRRGRHQRGRQRQRPGAPQRGGTARRRGAAGTTSRRTGPASRPRRASPWARTPRSRSTTSTSARTASRTTASPTSTATRSPGRSVSRASAFYGVEGGDTERVNAHVATAQLQHRFGESLQLTNSLRFGSVDRYALPTAPRGLAPTSARPPSAGSASRRARTTPTSPTSSTSAASSQTGFLKHTANAGLELAYETRQQNRDNLNAVGLPTGPNLTADLFTPGPLAGPLRRQPRLPQLQRQQAVVAGRLRGGSARNHPLPRGARLRARRRLRHPLRRRRRHARVTPAREPGRPVQLARGRRSRTPWSTRASTPRTARPPIPRRRPACSPTGTASLEPERNATLEFGAKADLFEDRLGLDAAVFRIDKLNARVPNTDPSGPPSVLDGAQRVQGFNVGVTGTLTARWKVIANYTHMDSEIREHTNAYLVGQPLPNTPQRSFSMWTTVTPLEHLTLGAGAVYQDVTTVNNPASATVAYVKVPNFWRFDRRRQLRAVEPGRPAAQPQQPLQRALLRAVLGRAGRAGEGPLGQPHRPGPLLARTPPGEAAGAGEATGPPWL